MGLKPSTLRGVIAEVGALYKRFQIVSADGWRSAEEELEYEVGGGLTLRGRVDAVFDDPRGVRLVDWKTGTLGVAHDQLDFYTVLWALVHGELPAVVEAASVLSGERYELTPTVSHVRDSAGRIATMADTLRGGFLDPGSVARHGGPGCRYCPLRDDCEEGVAALRVLSA